MGMRIVRGRDIAASDTSDTPLVAVVNQALVNRYFPGQDVIGKRLEIGFNDPPQWRVIVGVIADVHIRGLDQDSPVQVYGAFYQMPSIFPDSAPPLSIAVRTEQDPAALADSVRARVQASDKTLPIYALQPMRKVVEQSLAQRRFSLILLAMFAGLAVVLAAIGIYGVISYAVSQRTSEIGLRMALGARRGQVLLLIEKEALMLVGVGVAVGAAGAYLLSRLAQAFLFQVSATDPATFGAVAMVLLAVAAASSFLPAHRAARVDPIAALRHR
jgi:putative ABC transport system permease protein